MSSWFKIKCYNSEAILKGSEIPLREQRRCIDISKIKSYSKLF